MTDDLPVPRRITRILPIGVKDGPATLIATCSDGSVWELDRRAAWQGGSGVSGAQEWQRLPSIPEFDEVGEGA